MRLTLCLLIPITPLGTFLLIKMIPIMLLTPNQPPGWLQMLREFHPYRTHWSCLLLIPWCWFGLKINIINLNFTMGGWHLQHYWTDWFHITGLSNWGLECTPWFSFTHSIIHLHLVEDRCQEFALMLLDPLFQHLTPSLRNTESVLRFLSLDFVEFQI